MSKQTIKNEALLDLEAGLTSQLLALWDRYWMDRSRDIGQAADEQRWADAHELVEKVDMGAVFAKREKLFETIGMASLLLGASRLGRINTTSVYKDPPKDWLTSAVKHCEIMLGVNATRALRLELHLILDKREYAESPSNSVTVEEVFKATAGKNKYVPQSVRNLQALSQTMRASGSKRGASYIGLAANLHTSRLSSAGFLLEAAALNIKLYQVSEVMDSRTCSVCRRMHGMEFPVAQGISHLAQVFQTTDPSALSVLSPWPKQTKQGLKAFAAMDRDALLDARFHLPPYHPNCHGIIVPVGTIPVFDLGDLGAALAGMDLAPDVLAERLFGNRADLNQTASILFPEGATSALYDLEEQLEPEDGELEIE